MEDGGVEGCVFVDYDGDVAGGVEDFVFEFFYSGREGLILGGDVSLGDSTDEMLKSERKSDVHRERGCEICKNKRQKDSSEQHLLEIVPGRGITKKQTIRAERRIASFKYT